jgi:virginiamycin B lyase
MVLSLPPASSEWLTFVLPNLPPGTYQATVTVDADNQIVESRECNNKATETIIVPTDVAYLPLVGSRFERTSRQSVSLPEQGSYLEIANSPGPNAAKPSGSPTDDRTGFRQFRVPTANSFPAQMVLDSRGRVWLTERDANKLARFDPETSTWDEFEIPTPNSMPWGIDLDANGNVWFTESASGANKIGMLDISAVPVPLFTEYPVPTPGSEPWNLVVGADGTVWFTERVGNKIGKLVPGIGVTNEYPIPTPDAKPSGIGIHRSAFSGRVYDYIWFTETAASKVGQLSATAEQILERRLVENTNPQELVMTPSGDVWWTEPGSNRIVLFAPSTLSLVLQLDVPTAGAIPYGIALDGNSAVWFTERAASKLGRFTGFVPLSEYTLPDPNSQPIGLAVDTDGCAWYSAPGVNKIGHYCPPPTFRQYLPFAFSW